MKDKQYNQSHLFNQNFLTRGRAFKKEVSLDGKCHQKIGSIRVKSGQKIGVNRCESVQFLTNAGTKMRVNECRWVQKIGTNRGKSGRFMRQKCYQMRPNATRKQGDQRRLKATKNDPLTYHYLILPNNLSMFCVGQKLL